MDILKQIGQEWENTLHIHLVLCEEEECPPNLSLMVAREGFQLTSWDEESIVSEMRVALGDKSAEHFLQLSADEKVRAALLLIACLEGGDMVMSPRYDLSSPYALMNRPDEDENRSCFYLKGEEIVAIFSRRNHSMKIKNMLKSLFPLETIDTTIQREKEATDEQGTPIERVDGNDSESLRSRNEVVQEPHVSALEGENIEEDDEEEQIWKQTVQLGQLSWLRQLMGN